MPKREYRFDVAFSFAGTHRDKVRAVAELVSDSLDAGIVGRSHGRVFFDEWFEDELAGDDAEVELQRIYGEQSLMVVADVSEDYSDRAWCQAEARAVRALRMSLDTAGDSPDRKRLTYVRFDDGDVPGVLRNAIVWDGRSKSAAQLADLVLSRLSKLRDDMAKAVEAVPFPSAPARSIYSSSPIVLLPWYRTRATILVVGSLAVAAILIFMFVRNGGNKENGLVSKTRQWCVTINPRMDNKHTQCFDERGACERYRGIAEASKQSNPLRTVSTCDFMLPIE